MHAVTMSGSGDVDVMAWQKAPDPVAGPGEVLIDVVASAVNRADLLQRQGMYPPPPGASTILGLECSGVIAAVGGGVDGWRVGDEVCALLAGGGYAERVAVPAGQCMPLPAGVDMVTAAALPEAGCTVWSNVVMSARLQPSESFLIHGGASGIGTMAIQIAKAFGANPVMCTAGTAAKLDRCRALGAGITINYREEDFVGVVRDATDGHGADIVLDIIGAANLARNVEALAYDGRLVVIGLQGGARAELDLGVLLRSRAAIYATNLRSRSQSQKAGICSTVVSGLWPLIATGQVKPVIHASFPMTDVAAAHQLVADSGHVGKVLLVRP